MSKDPAVLFYTSDFYTGTAFMSNEQVGKYIRLLCLQHQHGRLKDEHMLNICQSYDKDIYSKFIKDENGLFYNERLEIEAIKRKAYCEGRRLNKLKDYHMSRHMSEHMSEPKSGHMEKRKEKIEIRNKKIIKDKIFIKPSLEEVIEYCKSKAKTVDGEYYYQINEAKGWIMNSGLPVKNWKAHILTWERINKSKDKQNQDSLKIL
jgi:hypothetical protein